MSNNELFLPIQWEGTGLKKRARTSRMIIVSEFVDVSIREIDASDAPVCVKGDILDIRFFEDAFWYPFSMWEEGIANPRPNENSHKQYLKQGPNANDSGERFYARRPIRAENTENYYLCEHVRDFNVGDYKEIDLKGRDNAIAEVYQKASNFILIDGYLWFKAGAPSLLAVLNYAGDDQYSITVKLLPCDAVERNLVNRPRGSALFELDATEDMIQKINTKGTDIDMPEFEVLMPNAYDSSIADIDFAYVANEKLTDWWIDITRKRSIDDLDVGELYEFTNVTSNLKRYNDGIVEIGDLEHAIAEATMHGYCREYFERILEIYHDRKQVSDEIDLGQIGA